MNQHFVLQSAEGQQNNFIIVNNVEWGVKRYLLSVSTIKYYCVLCLLHVIHDIINYT